MTPHSREKTFIDPILSVLVLLCTVLVGWLGSSSAVLSRPVMRLGCESKSVDDGDDETLLALTDFLLCPREFFFPAGAGGRAGASLAKRTRPALIQ